MTLSTTLHAYLSRQFILWIFVVFATLMSIVAMFDFVELLRRASGKPDVTSDVLLQLSLLKLPHLVQDMLPFVMLLGSMFCFWKLARSNELVVARAAGVSAWQFLAGPIVITFMVGVVVITAFNPFAAAMRTHYEALESRYLGKDRAEFAVSESGVWLRQSSAGQQSIIHAEEVIGKGNSARLGGVTVFEVRDNETFQRRIDAQTATLRDGYWQLNIVVVSDATGESIPRQKYTLPTDLTFQGIQDSFASADTLSFWDLPKFIGTMEDAGFTAVAHRLHLHSLMAMPFLLCAMVLIAAAFSIKTSRRSSTGLMIVGGVLSGFLLHFFTNVVHALGQSTGIPPIFAAWMPAGFSMMLGVTALLHLEDG